MISEEEKYYMLSNAYVPEHIPDMMSYLSGGEPYLIDDKYLILLLNKCLIFIGYPLKPPKDSEEITYHIEAAIKRFSPSNVLIVVESGSSKFFQRFKKIEEDFYYTIDLKNLSIDRKLMKLLEKIHKRIKIEIERQTTIEHLRLTEEFINSRKLPDNIKELYKRLPGYMKTCKDIFYLSAYNEKGNLTGYYIVESEARNFSAYMIGCISRVNYEPHTSDYLMSELIRISQDMDKKFINLGLGVNEGIRRFKEKWGAIKSLKYEVYEYESYSSKIFNYFDITI